MKNKFNSSVLYRGHLYGLDEGILACISAETGQRAWKGGRYGYGQLLLANGHLIVLSEQGDLALVKATPERHVELARFSALSGKTWNNPEIATKPVGFPAASTPTPIPIPTPARRPVNPFLSRDPHQKARRLARALISDMIVYQPDKRKKALEEGNLKQVFDEEIKKSWEQFVGDVGEELANSTSFFKEALNEILAGGQSVF